MATFGVSARTLVHLGAELITSDEIAIFELIKNSFDADSKSVSIRFVFPIPRNVIEELLETFPRNHSVPSSDRLRRAKQIISDHSRSDMGEATNTHMKSCVEKLMSAKTSLSARQTLEKMNFIEVVDKGHGMTPSELETVFLTIGTASRVNKRKKDSTVYLGNKGIGRLAMMRLGRKAKIFSWTETEGQAGSIHFDWRKFDDPELMIDQINFPIRRTAKPDGAKSGTKLTIYHIENDWTQDDITKKIIGKFIRRLKNPFSNGANSFRVDITYNDGKRLPIPPLDENLEKIVDRKLTLDFSPHLPGDQFRQAIKTVLTNPKATHEGSVVVRTIDDVCRKFGVTEKQLKKVGEFRLELSWFNRRNLAQAGLGSALKDMRAELDVWCGGIAIYRDGFRVGLTGSQEHDDWLELDRYALRSGGYVVNRIQTVGVLEITKEGNPHLIDRSNREGLIETPEVELVKKILLEFGVGLLRTQVKVDIIVEEKVKIAELIADGTGDVDDRLRQASNNLTSIKERVPEELNSQVIELGKHLHFISGQVTKYKEAFSQLKETREDILELAGVGTVMHSILHELTRTTSQTKELMSKVAKNADPTTKALVEKLEAEIRAINTRLSQLDPLSPSGRLRKGKFDIAKLVKTIIEGYKARCERHEITIEFTIDDADADKSVIVNMVKGFFSLAIENLILNSVYWTQQYLKAGESERVIKIDLDSVSKVIVFSDNGPGISAADRLSIFKPGFSLRPKGNGFGLYIAAEVAGYHGAKLFLGDPDPEDNRLRTFVIELPKE